MIKLKILLLTAPVLAFSIPAFARPLADSVGVENQNGKKVILHKLDPKDNYYSIGRRYNVKPAIIIQYNTNAKMTIGTIIKVPTDLPFDQPAVVQNKPKVQQQQPVVQPQQQVAQQPVTQAPQQQPAANTTQYKVSQGETLYSIAKRFGSSVDDIMKLNNLPSNTISPGQMLQIRMGGAPQTPVQAPPVQQPQQQVANTNQQPVNQSAMMQPQNVQHPTTTRDSSTPSNPTATVDSATLGDRHVNGSKFGLFEKDEKGVATWIDDATLDPKKKLVLHRTAPIGTVIKITNPMTNRTTFAKVVGRFSDSEATKNVLIVMTKNTADALGALDKRFQVSISYGTPNE